MNGLTVTVEREFTEYRDKLFAASNTWSSCENMDSLLLEWWLIKYAKVTPPENWRHDIIVGAHKIDLKEISGDWWTVKDASYNRMAKSLDMGELTDYLYYSTQRTTENLLRAGDRVKFKFQSLVKAADALNTCTNRGKYNNDESYCSLTSLQMANYMI